MKTSEDSVGVRLQKIISDAGLSSRREAEEMIRDGEITINGRVAKIGDKATPGKDHIKVRGKLLRVSPERVALAFYKPRGVMTTAPSNQSDKVRGTIWEFLGRVRERVSAVGKLDTDTEGLLLLTNDGELSQRLIRSKFEVPKIYTVKIDGHLEDKKIKRLLHGVDVEGSRVRMSAIDPIRDTTGKQWFKVTLTDPKNRTIRKIFEAVGHPVDKVRRESFGGITLKGMDRGQWRYLGSDELDALKKWVGMKGNK